MTIKPVCFEGKKMIAHRGASALETENSNAAFVAAGNRSYWGIETDVHRTKDGRFIIIHDDTTTRITGKALCVEETTFEELRQLRLLNVHGKTPRYDLVLPSLAEYAAICRYYEKNAVLEIKNPMAQEDIAEILAILKEEEMLEKTVFISFTYENLVLVRRLFPEARVQFLCAKMTEELLESMVRDRFDLDIHHSGATPEVVSALHRAGLEINVWTVDDPRQCEELLKMGVDYITSNSCE